MRYARSGRRILALVMAMALLATACGNDDDAGTSAPAPEPAPATEAPATPEPPAPTEEPPPPEPEPAPEPVSVSLRLPWFPNTQFSGSYVAAAKGFFADEGLDVEINPGGFDVNSITLVAAGSDTFGLHDTGSLLFAAAEEIPLMTVATYFHKHPGAVMALADSGIETLEDFVGRRIGFAEGGPWQLTQAMLAKNGIDIDDIDKVATGFDLAPILNGDVDLKTVFSTNEPILAELQGFESRVFVPYDYGVETSANALFTTRSYFDDNPEVVCGMVRAIARGWEYAFDNPEEAVDIVLAIDPDNLDRDKESRSLEAIKDAVWTPDAQADGIGSMKHSRWETADEVLRTYGGLEAELDLNSVYSDTCFTS
ncbi:ABC transporter substrate-binding protein [Candidatus Poriferisocius sp.]|uniref:ABC transporter substrate-binding protein n=1 Tax=Candidatus Poriferisocius sp. TaxID=3101276 RepID=UPI003B5C4524